MTTPNTDVTPALERALRHPPIDGSSVPGTHDQAVAYAERLELRHHEDVEKLQRAMVVATLPVEWLTLVKSCACIPCLALVRGWAKSRPIEEAERQKARGVDLRLSPIEARTLSALARGLSNKDIGLEIGQGASTVKNRVTRIFTILHVHSRMEAARRAMELGLVDRPA